MNWDEQKISSLDLITNTIPVNKKTIQRLFMTFLETFTTTTTVYSHILSSNINQGIYTLTINLEHILQFDESLATQLHKDPQACLEAFVEGIVSVYNIDNHGGFQVHIVSGAHITPIRNIGAERLNTIIRIKGIVVSASSVFTKPKHVHIVCRNCLVGRMATDILPRTCEKKECPIDPFIIVPEKSIVSDVQYVKMQEMFEDIPVGETPRHFGLMFEKRLVNRVVPGSVVTVTGIYSIKNSDNNKSSPFIKVIGLEEDEQKGIKNFSEAEIEEFKNMSKDGIYEKIMNSIAPSICGHEDIKRALACMLFGGTRKVLDDQISLRGDINILLLGDPGVAKSQLLKFIERVSPISVYTSGKGSSAAGLTASVIRDRNGEFYLEGGALVLADNGICCIDEFDKMGDQDRVAIHEAMEQQTISIAKAGITTMLNTRTSILAAANPVFGRYDDFKTRDENIEFGTTILSRFDCIFIIKDKSGPNDLKMARHVLNIHKQVENDDNSDEGDDKSEDSDIIPLEKLRRYKQYAKQRIRPVLSENASKQLIKYYADTRKEVKKIEKDTLKRSSVPITVRQLEAIIRLSEALAKMELNVSVTESHVEEAIRIFNVSTMNAVLQGHMLEGMIRPDLLERIENICRKIKEILPVGASIKFNKLLRKLSNENDGVCKKAIEYMVKQNKLVMKDMGRILIRQP